VRRVGLTFEPSNRTPEVEGYPMKLWNIEIFLLDEAGNPTDASIFTKVVYNLHPSFANPVQSKFLDTTLFSNPC
jgi:transcription initiation factor IIF auxiliary subunit